MEDQHQKLPSALLQSKLLKEDQELKDHLMIEKIKEMMKITIFKDKN